jgi:hypothetical protein
MQNIATTKKKTGDMKPPTAAPTAVTWNTGCSRMTSSDVTAIGMASVIQRTIAMVNTPARRVACGVSPSGVGSTTVSTAASTASTRPIHVAARCDDAAGVAV